MTSDDGTLFEIPEVYKPRKPKPTADPHKWKWAKFKGRITCDLCIMNVHDGIVDTPRSTAKHALTIGARRWLLCSVHAAQVRNGERKLDARP